MDILFDYMEIDPRFYRELMILESEIRQMEELENEKVEWPSE